MTLNCEILLVRFYCLDLLFSSTYLKLQLLSFTVHRILLMSLTTARSIHTSLSAVKPASQAKFLPQRSLPTKRLASARLADSKLPPNMISKRATVRRSRVLKDLDISKYPGYVCSPARSPRQLTSAWTLKPSKRVAAFEATPFHIYRDPESSIPRSMPRVTLAFYLDKENIEPIVLS